MNVPSPVGIWGVRPSRIREYFELSKPRVTAMSGFATLVGFYLGHSGPLSSASVMTGILTLVGAVLAGAGASALNQVMEHKRDALMDRTANRPIPAGRVRLGEGLLFGVCVSLAGLCLLAVGVNVVAATMTLVTLVIYLAVYTPLKSVTPMALIVGAIPGALPPVIGWTAATGSLDAMAALPFGILFIWQLPHFLSIAWMYRSDFERAGYPVLPVLDPTGRRTVRHMIVYSLALIPVSLLPTPLGLAGAVYYVGALVCGFAFLAAACEVARLKTRDAARQHVLASLVYLSLVFSLLTIDKVVT